MVDTFSTKQRSEIMKAVKSKDNKSTELKLIEIFKACRIKGWRRNYKLIGRPDFVFPQKRIALFADGCFWHGHNCRNITPSDNADYWRIKINKNKARDQAVADELSRKGWQVVRIWECEIKKKDIQKLIATGKFTTTESGMDGSKPSTCH